MERRPDAVPGCNKAKMERRPDAVPDCNKWRTCGDTVANGSAGTGRKIGRVGSWINSQGKKNNKKNCFSTLLCTDSGRGALF